jgi:hypothetical protein
MANFVEIRETSISTEPFCKPSASKGRSSSTGGGQMLNGGAHFFSAGALSLLFCAAHAQSPQATVQLVVTTERAANDNDHSNWTYLEELRKPKEHVLQQVIATQHGNVNRILEKNDQKIVESQQRDDIQKFLQDPKEQKKQIAESDHDLQQVDVLLKLLPEAFRWTQTKESSTNTFLHFEPNPEFRPPTREARVFGAMAGDLVVDNQQHRIRSMSGHLIHDVTFGGGLLGRLKEGSSFSLEQAQVGETLWQLTAINVHLAGNAFLFKSISLQQDDTRSHFEPEPAVLSLDQAAILVMKQQE